MVSRKVHLWGLAIAVLFLWLAPAGLREGRCADVFRETFDSRQDSATIDGVDSWRVSAGSLSSAVVTSGTTSTGEGKSLKLTNASVPVVVGRSADYGDLSPAWVEFVVKPALGNQSTTVPAGGVGAVCFDLSGNVFAADGSAWVSTGRTFATDTWYRVLLKIDLSTHLYDLYLTPADTTKIPFVPDKQGLHFIDPAVNRLSRVGFDGAYHASLAGNTYVDEIIVHFTDRIEIITPLQNLVKNRPSGPITFQLQNSNSEPQTAWQDLVFDLYTSTEGGQFSLSREDWQPVSQAILPEGAQQATFYYKASSEGKPVIGVKETPDRGWREASQQLNVTAEAQSFEVSVTSPQVAGRAFTAQITAKDGSGAVDTSYAGTVRVEVRYVDPAAGTRRITPATGAGFEEGVLNLALTYPDCGLVQIEVCDGEDDTKAGVSGQILFVPARFAVTPDGTRQVVARPFSLSVEALDESGQIAPNYFGPTVVQAVAANPPEAAGALLTPAQLEAAQFQNGTAQASASYNRWGTVNIEVHDSANPLQMGLAEGVFFGPASLELKMREPPGRDFYYSGENIEAVLTVLDANGQAVQNFQGPAAVSASPELELPQVYEFTPADGGLKSVLFSASEPGYYTLKAEAPAYALSTTAPPFQVKQATVEVISGVAPVGTTEVEVQIVDEKGRRITSENTLVIQLSFQEEDPNDSLFLSSPGKPVLFRNGLAKVVLSNSEAETVTVTPEAADGFKIKAGTVTFGRVGQGGIGTLMLLEQKDDQGLSPRKEQDTHEG